jgi:hypothetical protein
VGATNSEDTATIGLDPSISEIVSKQGKLIGVDSADAIGRGFISSEDNYATQFTSIGEPALLVSTSCESSDTVRWKFRASGDKNWIFGLIVEDEKLDSSILTRAQPDVQSRIFLTGSTDNCQYHDKWVSVSVDFQAGSMVLSCDDMTAERSFQVKDQTMRLALSAGKGAVIMVARTENLEDPLTNSAPTALPSIYKKVRDLAVLHCARIIKKHAFWYSISIPRAITMQLLTALLRHSP